jgi:hypothetical protein
LQKTILSFLPFLKDKSLKPLCFTKLMSKILALLNKLSRERVLKEKKTRRLPKERLPKERLPTKALPKEPVPQEPISQEPIPLESPLEAPIESETTATTTTMVKKRHPKATAHNNRLLALPIELRLQIYDELLAIPRTVHMLERKVKSHLHNIRKFDKQLFSRRGQLRYKFSSPRAGYYDPRTTTFAARFTDDDDCAHLLWLSERPRAAPRASSPARQGASQGGLANRPAETGDLIYGICSEATKRLNHWIWGQVHNQLRCGPEIHILELEFPKICSAISVMKALLLSRLQGWRELRELSVLRIRIRAGNGGPLNELEMAVLRGLAANLSHEMQRKVLLRKGPKIDIAW